VCRSSEQPVDIDQHDARSWCRASHRAVCGRRWFSSTRSLRRTQETLRRQVRPIRYVDGPVGLCATIVHVCTYNEMRVGLDYRASAYIVIIIFIRHMTYNTVKHTDKTHKIEKNTKSRPQKTTEDMRNISDVLSTDNDA